LPEFTHNPLLIGKYTYLLAHFCEDLARDLLD